MGWAEGSGDSVQVYWRVIGVTYHCFREWDRGGFLSLCGQYQIQRAGSRRAPPAYLRCAKCDDVVRVNQSTRQPVNQSTRKRFTD